MVNYYNKGNEIIKDMKDNEDFMETIKQRNDELNKLQIEDENPKKRDSSIEGKAISQQNSEKLFQIKILFRDVPVPGAVNTAPLDPQPVLSASLVGHDNAEVMEAFLEIDPSLEKVASAYGPVIDMDRCNTTACSMEEPDS